MIKLIANGTTNVSIFFPFIGIFKLLSATNVTYLTSSKACDLNFLTCCSTFSLLQGFHMAVCPVFSAPSILETYGIGTYFFHISMMIKRMLKNLVVWHCPLRVPFESFDLKRFQLHWNVVVFQKKEKILWTCVCDCLHHSFIPY